MLADNTCLDRNQILMGLLMICSEHCLYVDLRGHRQLGRFFPLGFNRILIFFSFSETCSLLVLALRIVSRTAVPPW